MQYKHEYVYIYICTYMTTLRVIGRLRVCGGDVRKADFLMCNEVVQI